MKNEFQKRVLSSLVFYHYPFFLLLKDHIFLFFFYLYFFNFIYEWIKMCKKNSYLNFGIFFY